MIVLAGVVRALWRVAARAPDAPFWLAALLWWIAPIAALTATRFPPHIVYLLLSVPGGFVLAAPILNAVARRGFAVALAVLLTVNSFGLLDAARVQIAAHPAGIGLDTLSIRAVIPFQLTARRLADDYGVSEFYAALSPASLTAKVGREVGAVSWFELPQFEIFKVDQPAVYVRWEHGRLAAALPLAERAATLEYPGEDLVTFDVVPAYRRIQLASLAANVVEWPTAEGLTLVGYDLSPAFDELTVYWTVDALADERSGWILAPYVHFTNPQGELVANVGAPGLSGYYYRLGDVYRYVISVPPLPAGDYQLELGLYDGLHSRGITFLPPGETPRPAYTARLTVH